MTFKSDRFFDLVAAGWSAMSITMGWQGAEARLAPNLGGAWAFDCKKRRDDEILRWRHLVESTIVERFVRAFEPPEEALLLSEGVWEREVAREIVLLVSRRLYQETTKLAEANLEKALARVSGR